MTALALALFLAWLGASAVIAWLWGRFVRVGMVELQRETPP